MPSRRAAPLERMVSMPKASNTAVRMAAPPASTGARSTGRPSRRRSETCPARSSDLRSFFSALAVTPPADQPEARATASMEVIVPDEPMHSCQP